jgi:hypothetical protein
MSETERRIIEAAKLYASWQAMVKDGQRDGSTLGNRDRTAQALLDAAMDLAK